MQAKLYSILLIFFILFIGNGCSKDTTSPKSMTLNIIHMNDIHSHLDEEELKLDFNGTLIRTSAGGYPRMATIVKNLIKTLPNTLLLNAGDALQGTLYYTLFKGEVDAKMMNTFEWDSFVLGNHEFDDGDTNLANFINQLTIPIIAANVYANENNKLFSKWQPYIIRYFNAEAVAIIGIDTLKDTKDSSNPGPDILFYDEIITTQKYINKLEDLGVNKIIVLSHFGYENDIYLASQVRGIDIIVGGHSHTLLGSYESLGLSTTAKYPKETTSPLGKKVCIVQAWSFAKIVGTLNINFDENGTVLSCKGTPILGISDNFMTKDAQGKYVDLNITQKNSILNIIQNRADITIAQKDTKLQTILDNYKEKVDEKEKEVIGYADVTIAHIRIPGHDYGSNKGSEFPLGSNVTPLVAKAFYKRVNNSDLVILNAGAVRISIDAGEISIGTAYTLLPFSNTLYSIKMNAQDIHNVLEDALSNYYDNAGSDGSFPYAYAMRYDINMKNKKGNRVQNIEILDKDTNNYQTLDANKTYNVTTISYLASGKDGYTTSSTIKGTDTYFDYANSFVEYVKALNADGKTISKLSQDEHPIKNYIE